MAWKLVSDKFHLDLDGDRILGRADFLDNPQLSRKHAKFTINDGCVYVTDLDSTNGTAVEGQPLRANTPKQISEGDAIKMGNITLTLQSTDSIKELNASRVVAWTTSGTALAMFAYIFLASPSE